MNVQWCHFVVFCGGEIVISQIKFDPSFWSSTLLPKLRAFYTKFAAREILSGRYFLEHYKPFLEAPTGAPWFYMYLVYQQSKLNLLILCTPIWNSYSVKHELKLYLMCLSPAVLYSHTLHTLISMDWSSSLLQLQSIFQKNNVSAVPTKICPLETIQE